MTTTRDEHIDPNPGTATDTVPVSVPKTISGLYTLRLLDAACKKEMDLLSFIWTVDPMKVRVGERQCADGGGGEPVEQGDSAGGGQGIDIQPVIAAAYTIVEDVAPLQPMRQKKRKTVAMLLVGAVLNVEVRGEPIPTLPFVTSFVSATPERENKNPANSKLKLTIVRSPTPIIATVMITTVDAAATAKETTVKSSLFVAGSPQLAGWTLPPGGFFFFFKGWSVTNGSRLDDGQVCHEMLDEFALPKFFASIRGMEHDQLFTEFNVGAARQVSLSAEVRMHAEYNIKEKRKLRAVVEEKDILLRAKGEEVDILKAQLLMKEAETAEAIRLRTEASKFEVVEKSLRDEVESLKECNTTLKKEKSMLDVRVSDLAAIVKVREQEAADSNAMVTTVKLQNDKLADLVHALEVTCSGLRDQILTYEHLKEQFEEFQDVQMRMVGDKLAKLEVFLTKCLNSSEYLLALGAAISQAIEKGMQDVLVAGIEHGAHGKSLEDLVAYNPSAEEDYNAALQELRSVDFSLLAKLKSQKNASVETIMNLLRLESPLVDAPGMSDLQPDMDQLMVPIHRSEDQAVLGSTSLSFALSVSHGRVERIRKNIAEHRSALAGVYVPLVKPLSVQSLTGATGTSDVLPTAVATTTALSTTFASASTVPSVSVDDYIIADADNEENVQLNVEEEKQGKGEGSVAGMVEVEFEKEELGTTP
ncbi:hypothetical protein Tco_0907785 [Tanacetum coccineum]|uniref:Transposase (Putative), gypsy type n=1 Tax=Tanacetum coccineum TaxID=301880 RepID=A0ABQ5CK98_9ASTR